MKVNADSAIKPDSLTSRPHSSTFVPGGDRARPAESVSEELVEDCECPEGAGGGFVWGGLKMPSPLACGHVC